MQLERKLRHSVTHREILRGEEVKTFRDEHVNYVDIAGPQTIIVEHRDGQQRECYPSFICAQIVEEAP